MPFETKIEIPPLRGMYAEPWSLAKIAKLLGSFGPAAVVASLSIGAGETIMVTGLGAWAGYGLLWLLVLSVIVKSGFVTYMIGRYTAVTGQLIGHRLVMLPGPRGWLLLTIVVVEISLISMGLTTLAKPCGNLITFVLWDALPHSLSFGTWENLWSMGLIGLALACGLLSSYSALERQQIIICGILVTGTLVALAIVRPNLPELVRGAVRFSHLPAAGAWAPAAAREYYFLNLVTVFGFIGGSLSGYLAYSNWITLHGWGLASHPEIDEIRARASQHRRIRYLPDEPAQAARLRALLAPLHWDIAIGAAVLMIVTAAFLTSGAEVLYPRKQVLSGDAFELLTKQASIWRHIHVVLVPVYYVVVVAALWGTMATVPEAICRVAHDFLGAIWPRFRAVSLRRFQLVMSAWFFLTSLIWIWNGITFDLMTQIGAFLTLNLGVGIVCLAAVYFNATLPRLYRPHLLTLIGGTLSGMILLACAAVSAWGLWQKMAAQL